SHIRLVWPRFRVGRDRILKRENARSPFLSATGAVNQMRFLLFATSVVLMLAPWAVSAQDEPGPTEGAEAEAQAEASREQRRVRRLGDVVGSETAEFDIDFENLDIPQQPVQEVPKVSLPDPQQDAELQRLLRQRAFVPDDPETLADISALLDEVEADINQALAQGDLALAQQLAGVIAEREPGRAVIAEVQAALDRQESLAETLQRATAALEAGRLTEPAGDNAAELFARALDMDPDNQAGRTG